MQVSWTPAPAVVVTTGPWVISGGSGGTYTVSLAVWDLTPGMSLQPVTWHWKRGKCVRVVVQSDPRVCSNIGVSNTEHFYPTLLLPEGSWNTWIQFLDNGRLAPQLKSLFCLLPRKAHTVIPNNSPFPLQNL
ncbi:hypothetical protein E2C01_037668 [Portunus trituberculatus]|uniref:Uncharacterized protein n=1 Tax=Portunus trituberculatus TaxID=210409 RepID=A0A5B7FFK1_PORTR|nr:hypothetical protein [Portunus trituberculatus]